MAPISEECVFFVPSGEIFLDGGGLILVAEPEVPEKSCHSIIPSSCSELYGSVLCELSILSDFWEISLGYSKFFGWFACLPIIFSAIPFLSIKFSLHP